MAITTPLLALLCILVTSTLIQATALRLSDIQGLVGFPTACTNAYDAPINDCDDSHYTTGQLCSCSSACQSALEAVTTSINNACTAPGGTTSLIGLFQNQQAVNFLCSPPENGQGCPAGSGSTASSSTGSASSTTATTQTDLSSTSFSSQSSTTATSDSMSTSSTSSGSSTTGSSTSSTTPASVIQTSTTSTTTSARASKTQTPLQESGGGGSPFDVSSQQQSAAATTHSFDTHVFVLAFLAACALL